MTLRTIRVRLRRALPYLLIAVSAGMGLWAVALFHARRPAVLVTRAGAPTPSAVKPRQSAIDTYTVAADLPRYLEIPKIGVPKSRVVGLGVGTNNQIATPNNLYDVGWYRASGKPGQAGAMFMYGHVSGWQANGIFYNLYKLQAGDMISVTRGDNRVFRYKVTATKRYPVNAVDMAAVLVPVTAGRQGLDLMTCAGKLDQSTGEFSERLVVFAVLQH